MADEDFNQADLEAVVAELGDSAGLDAVEQRLETIAPQLQKLLDSALSAGGWFDDAHESMVLKTATQPDADQRIAEVRNFVLEQTRLGMLVGVAVGWELADRLESKRSTSP
ncbi:MAG: hypothetical protein ACRDKE_10470 [Solirubrobacterales bacterium]